jgi:hypothetical protein
MEMLRRALWDVFADGARIVADDGTVATTRTLDAGHLTLPTGRIVASDPLLDPWNEPFSIRVRPGTYSVLLAVVSGEPALVMVSFDDGPPVSWQLTDPPAFSVDSATGCLMDYKVCRFLRRKAEADKYERYSRRFGDALGETDGLWANYCIDAKSGANVVLFRTWGGDGSFQSYWGYTAGGSVACLVTDMYLDLDTVVRVEPPA